MKERFKKIWRNNFAWILPALIVICFFAILMIVGGVAPFGSYSFTFVDSMHQYLPFFSDFQGKLKEGGSLLYTWNIGLGLNFQSLLLYYMGCPLNFLVGLVSRKSIIAFMSVMIALKMSFSAGSFGYYLSRRSGKVRNTYLMVPFAVAYALGNYMIGYMWNIMWLDCIMVMPLIILGMERIIRGESARLYTVALFYSLFVNYYISFIMCIFLVLWYLVSAHKNVKSFFVNGFRFAGASLLAAGMAAFSLLTAYLAIMKTSSASQTFPEWEWYGNVFEILKQHFMLVAPIKNQNFDGAANLYCGVFTVLFLFIYVLSNRIRPWEKIRKILLVIFLIASMNQATLNYVWHGFHDQYGIPNRFAFVYIFTILVMAYDGLSRLRSIHPAVIYISGVLSIGFYTAALHFSDPDSKLSEIWLGIIAGVLIIIYAVMAEFKVEKFLKQKTLNLFIMLICLVELIGNAIYGFTEIGFADGEFYLKYCEEMQEITADVAEYEKMNGGDFYREEIVNPVMLDENTFDNMKSISTFCSTVRGDTVEVMGDMGFYTGVNEYLYHGATPYTNAILGVKYVYDHDDAYYPEIGYSDEFAENGSTKVYKNKYVLPIGFAVSPGLLAWMHDGYGDADKVNSFVRLSTGGGDIFESTLVDMDVHGMGCDATVASDPRAISYENGTGDNIYMDVEFTIPDDGIYFVELSGNYMENVTYKVNDEKLCDGRYFQQLFSMGELRRGDVASFNIKFSSSYSPSGQIGVKLSKWNGENFLKAINEHQKEVLNINEFSDSHIKGTINVSEKRLLFTSIPYDEGWTVKVDGKKKKIEKVGDAFIAIELPKGEHEIEMNYFPDGMKYGIMLSVSCFILFLAVFVVAPALKKGKAEYESLS